MHHTTNPVKAVKECYRVLGKVVMHIFKYVERWNYSGIFDGFCEKQYKEDKRLKNL